MADPEETSAEETGTESERETPLVIYEEETTEHLVEDLCEEFD